MLEDGFPTVTAACRAQGVDPVTDLIPVAPGAHYSCGGIAADMHGRTSIPGLYAVGEAASTGVHGANRLASNSLVEAVIMGRNAGESIAHASREAAMAPPTRNASDCDGTMASAWAARDGWQCGRDAQVTGMAPPPSASQRGRTLAGPCLPPRCPGTRGSCRDARRA